MRDIADRLRGAPGVRPASVVTAAEPVLGERLYHLINRRGEDIFRMSGAVGQNTADQILRGVMNPGQRYEDTTGQATNRALEQVSEFYGRRGISPRSPLVVTEGRREARDVAIQNAQNRLNAQNYDIAAGNQFGQFATGLESGARQEAASFINAELERALRGELGAASIEAGLPTQTAGSLLESAQAGGEAPFAALGSIASTLGNIPSTMETGRQNQELIDALRRLRGPSGIAPSTTSTLARNLGFGVRFP
jgi:hypothetical protein